LPREGFKTITVKRDVFRRFGDIKKLAKEEKSDMCNSDFLTELLNLYERGRNNITVDPD
jgi:predicted CopG family antitoxin